MGPTLVPSASDGPHVGPMNHTIRVVTGCVYYMYYLHLFQGSKTAQKMISLCWDVVVNQMLRTLSCIFPINSYINICCKNIYIHVYRKHKTYVRDMWFDAICLQTDVFDLFQFTNTCKWFNRNKSPQLWWIPFSMFSMSLSLMVYQSPK